MKAALDLAALDLAVAGSGVVVADGTRLFVYPAPGAAVSPYSLIPWPEMTVRLAEHGFLVEPVEDEGPDGAAADATPCRLHVRQTPVIVRGYRAGDEDAIRDLFRRSFHQELPLESWKWRYVDHPLGAHRISVAIDRDGRLIGHYGGYPASFVDGGAPETASSTTPALIAHQNGDVCTDRTARRLGHGGATLVRRLAQHFWAAYGEGRADFHYGFNTSTARTLQLRVVPGVRMLEPVSVWVADDIRPAASTGHAPRGELRAERVSRAGAEWDAFARQARRAYGLLACRDAASWNWRYADRPGRDDVLVIVRRGDRIVGGAVFQVLADETRWGDALFTPGEPAAAGVALACVRALGAPARVWAWFSPRPEWWTRILGDLGFREEPEPHGLWLVYAPFTPAAARLVPGLYYTWGDSDLF
jgi:hypothetical protein